jgi:hypothetical protein
LNNKAYPLYYLILSFLAGIILTILVFIGSSQVYSVKPFEEKQILAVGFLIACVFGLSCSWFPGWYRTTKTKKRNLISNSTKIQRKRIGHHPDCHQFKNHILKIYKNIYCAGCFGISCGLLCAIILMIMYLINPLKFSLFVLKIMFIIAISVIPFVFIEILYTKKNLILHIILNILFIISFFLLIVSTYELTSDIRFGFIAMIFSFLFLRTRIECSQINHASICNSCNESCKMY